MVLLPPLNCTANAWMNQIREYSKTYRVMVPHYPGYGRSEFSFEHSRFDQIANNIIEIISLLSVDRPINLMGWSLGGFVAQKIARKKPEMVKSLVLVNTSSKLDYDDSLENINRLAQLLMNDFMSGLPHLKAAEKVELLDDIRATYSNEIWVHYFNQVLLFDHAKAVAEIKVPTLLIAGEKDQMTPVAHLKEIHQKISNSVYFELETAGHYTPLCQPDRFNKLVTGFLNGKNKQELAS